MKKWLNLNKTIEKVHNTKAPAALEKNTTSTEQISTPNQCVKLNQIKKRKYNESFLGYGFTFNEIHNEQRPVCVICNDVLANESMKPGKLKRHLQTNHSEYIDKPTSFFERRLTLINQQKKVITKHISVPKKQIMASYSAAYLIAKAKKPDTIGEELILPAAVKIVEIIHGKEIAEAVRKVPMSNNTVSRRITEISNDILEQLIFRIKSSPKFSIQLDETTDVTNMAQLMTYVRYTFNDEFHEDLLFCRPLKARTTAENIFFKINQFFEENSLNWKDCLGVCTDGAAAMTGKIAGLVTLIKRQTNSTDIICTHCIIHREALVAKKIDPELHKVLQDAVSIINYIKSRALNSRLFSNLCKDMGSNYQKLLLHAEVRWLSRGRTLKRLIDLKDEVQIFLMGKNSIMEELFLNEKWLCSLYYLADIFERLNELNSALQGENTNILNLYDKIQGFIKKIEIWKIKIENDNIDMFPWTNIFIVENELPLSLVKTVVLNHLNCLEKQFQKYFSADLNTKKYDWIRQPFYMKVEELQHFDLKMQEELAELTTDGDLKMLFDKENLNNFWLLIRNEYPLLSAAALRILIPFATTYLCESGFSTLIYIKNKYRNSIVNIEDKIRPALSKIEPRFDLLLAKMQPHTN